jgi:tRNA (cytidine32/uridine32-2'-O)-methyltransferase
MHVHRGRVVKHPSSGLSTYRGEKMLFPRVRFVLVNTSHPGNLGSAARAMKTMGFSELVLVNPRLFPHQKADELACNAVDVLQGARVVASLEEAIGDCSLVVGTSARSRSIPWPLLAPREAAKRLVDESSQHQVAIVFGCEQTGLTNEELHLCHLHVHIPTNPDYSSLNLASAVQVLAYELRVYGLSHEPAVELGPENEEYWDNRLATNAELEGLFEHTEEMLVKIEFLNPKSPRQLMSRVRRLYTRARPDMMEVNILRGILTSMARALTLK